MRRNGEASIHVAAAESGEEEKWVQHASWQISPDVLAMVSYTGGAAAKFLQSIELYFMSESLLMHRQ